MPILKPKLRPPLKTINSHSLFLKPLFRCVFALALALALFSCGDKNDFGSNPSSSSEAVQIADNTTVITEQQAKQEVYSVNTNSGEIILPAESTAKNVVVENGYLAMGTNSKAEYGLLRKIVSKTTNASGQLVLQTEQAELTDVIKKGKASISGSLSAPSSQLDYQTYFLAGNELSNEVRVLSATDSFLVNGNKCQSINPTFVVDINNVIVAPGLVINGCLGLSVKYKIDIEIDDAKLQYFYFDIEPKEVRELSLTATRYAGTGPIALEKSVFSVPIGTITVLVGLVPVVVVVKFDAVVGVKGEVSTRLTIGGSGSSASKYGLKYTRSSGWTSFKENSRKFDVILPTVETKANAEVFVGPEILFLFYGLVGPQAYLNGYVAIEADTSLDPWWTIYGGARAGVGVELELKVPLVKNIGFSASFPDIFNFRKVIAKAEGPFRPPAPTTYTVTFNANGGSSVSSQTVTSGSRATKPSNPTRSSYTFGGWYTDQALTKAFDFSTAITANRTLYAKWTKDTVYYTVTFNANGGSSVSSRTVASGSRVTQPSNPTRSSYTFGGWYTDAAFNNAFNFSTAITANRTLYARWTKDTVYYTVTFNANGGSAVSSQRLAGGSRATEPSVPDRDGHNFRGWYTDSGLTQSFNFSTAITANRTLYAKWEPLRYEVNFNVDGGTPAVPTTSAPYGGKLTPPKVTKAGYSLAGWFRNSAKTVLFDFSKDTVTAPITLYAKWRALLSYQVEKVAVHYRTNFYGEKTQPTLTWALAASSTFTRQWVEWGKTRESLVRIANLFESNRSYTVPSSSVVAINGETTYYWQLKSPGNGITNASEVYSVTLRSCGPNEGDYVMVCSPATMEGVNTKGLAGKYKLQNDIDFGGKVYSKSIIAFNVGLSFWTVTSGTPFSGVFNGNGKVLKNGAVNNGSIFKAVGSSGVVSNLGSTLNTGNYYPAGGLVLVNYGTLSRVYSKGSVGGYSAGGIVGFNLGMVKRAHFMGTASGTTDVGCVSSLNRGGTIYDSYCGGYLVGDNWNGTIRRVYTTAGRVVEYRRSSAQGTQQYAYNGSSVDFSTLTSSNVASKFPGFDFTSVWKWSTTLKRPVLRNMPAGAEQ